MGCTFFVVLMSFVSVAFDDAEWKWNIAEVNAMKIVFFFLLLDENESWFRYFIVVGVNLWSLDYSFSFACSIEIWAFISVNRKAEKGTFRHPPNAIQFIDKRYDEWKNVSYSVCSALFTLAYAALGWVMLQEVEIEIEEISSWD